MDNTQYFNISLSTVNEEDEEISTLCDKYNINPRNIGLIKELKNYNLFLFLDDSSTMNDYCSKGLNKFNLLQNFTEMVLTIVNIHEDSLNLCFFNRSNIKSVTNNDQINKLFKKDPVGKANIYYKLRIVLNRLNKNEKPVLLLICTDNIFIDDSGYENLHKIKKLIKKYKNIHIRFILFTEDLYTINKYHSTFLNLKNISVFCNYNNINEEYKHALNKININDHILKLISMDIDEELNNKSCCVIS
jgi:hypothetical protein